MRPAVRWVIIVAVVTIAVLAVWVVLFLKIIDDGAHAGAKL